MCGKDRVYCVVERANVVVQRGCVDCVVEREFRYGRAILDGMEERELI